MVKTPKSAKIIVRYDDGSRRVIKLDGQITCISAPDAPARVGERVEYELTGVLVSDERRPPSSVISPAQRARDEARRREHAEKMVELIQVLRSAVRQPDSRAHLRWVMTRYTYDALAERQERLAQSVTLPFILMDSAISVAPEGLPRLMGWPIRIAGDGRMPLAVEVVMVNQTAGSTWVPA
jgi:hypothetical protein